jgi:hypothetical protein
MKSRPAGKVLEAATHNFFFLDFLCGGLKEFPNSMVEQNVFSLLVFIRYCSKGSF